MECTKKIGHGFYLFRLRLIIKKMCVVYFKSKEGFDVDGVFKTVGL